MLNTVIINYRTLPKYHVMDYDGLKYQLRAIEKNMPFIDKVIITCLNKDELPTYINTDTVNVVEYSEFIPSEKCPNYNQNVVEIYMPFIEKLGEEFLYIPECVFPFRTFNRRDFVSNGKIKQNFVPTTILENSVDSMSSSLATTTCGKGKKDGPTSVKPTIPIRVGLTSLYRTYIEKRKTMIDHYNSEFESIGNVSFTYMEYCCYWLGKCTESTLRTNDFDALADDTDIMVADPTASPMTVMEWMEYKQKVTEVLEERFGEKSKYEK